MKVEYHDDDDDDYSYTHRYIGIHQNKYIHANKYIYNNLIWKYIHIYFIAN